MMKKTIKSVPFSNPEIVETKSIIRRGILFYFLLLGSLVVYTMVSNVHIGVIKICLYVICFAFLLLLLPRNVLFGVFKDRMIISFIIFSVLWKIILVCQIAHSNNFFNLLFANIFESIYGLLIAGGVSFVFSYILQWVFKADPWGGGDLKLSAALGAMVGTDIYCYVLCFTLLIVTLWFLPAIPPFHLSWENRVVPSIAIHVCALGASVFILSGTLSLSFMIIYILWLVLLARVTYRLGVLDIETSP